MSECADTWYKRIQPTETVELSCSCPVTEHANAPESRTTDELTVVLLALFCDASVFVNVEPMLHVTVVTMAWHGRYYINLYYQM